jgi:hypothetical protein
MTRHRLLVPLFTASSLFVLLVAVAAGQGSVGPSWSADGSIISIVFPDIGKTDPASLSQSRAVNISVWPYTAQSCNQMPQELPVLWRARNNEPAKPLTAKPELISRYADGYRFPSLEYNNISADLSADPTAKYSFFVDWNSNVWVHAADPRTILPGQVVPTGLTEGSPQQLDARIQIVWPHDAQGREAPVAQATFVNIGIDLFEHETLRSVRPDDSTYGPVLLYIAAENQVIHSYLNPDQSSVQAGKTTYTTNGQVFPRWVFNNVPVDPGKRYHFLASALSPVKAVTTFPTIWTHAADVRTFLPKPKAPYYSDPAFYHCEP